jgi:hypothetical protein
MTIHLYEADLRNDGLFRFLYRALMECKGAKCVGDPRPLPRMVKPRDHRSAWATFDGHPVFFDMSDHAFLYDLAALARCEVYFKTNLNRPLTERVLGRAERLCDLPKVVPFVSLAPNIDELQQYAARRRDGMRGTVHRFVLGVLGGRYDVCHIAGIYMNPLQQDPPALLERGTPAPPAHYHYWIRFHCQQALKEAGISGYYRLIAKGDAWVDNKWVFRRLSMERYAARIFRARMAVVNTLPHALLPWKATESLALGRPLIIERAPLMEMPEPFRLERDVHYLELFPAVGGFDSSADLEDPRSARIFPAIAPETFRARAEWLKSVLADGEAVDDMTENAQRYSREILRAQVVSDYVCDSVRRFVH